MLLLFALLLTVAAAGYAAYRRDITAARRRVAAGSQIVMTRSGPLEYATLGAGAPVLVLHGASGGWDQGLISARALIAHGFQLIAPSRFGYLRTPLPTDASAESEADTFADLLDALKIHRLPVIAFSAGAASAVQFALRYPGRLSHLVLVVPGAGGLYATATAAAAPPRLVLEAIYRSDFAMWLLMRLAPRFMCRLVGVPSSLMPSLGDTDKAALDEVVESILPASERRVGLLNEGRLQRPGNLYPLEKIAVPTLLISAADDLYRTLPVARHAASIIPDARLLEFEMGGHLLLGHQDDVQREVSTFIADAGTELTEAA